MKDRLFRIRRLLSGATALLLIGGMMYSCSDDYDLPDKKPSWLGSSIYDYLVEQGTFKCTTQLIDSLGYAEVLAKTGSKTLFVADDDAYARFFANGPWKLNVPTGTKPEDVISKLTKSQMKLLLNSSMLDNAYLLEMMPHLSSGSRNSDGSYLDKNQCLRQPTSLAATDSIAYYDWNSVDKNGNSIIPATYNLGLANPGKVPDKDYWSRFRTQEKGGVRLATDGTVPLMVHWIAGQMGERKITNEDFAKIVGKTRDANDVYVYGSKVIKQDITCQNGYVNQLDEVYTTPSNMAEVIRTNGKSHYFSHMLDRFSAPYYNASLTSAYRQLNPASDSVFEKRYISLRSQGGAALEKEPKTNKVSYYLSYDPGWNTYYNESHGVQVDMGAMFVPTDEAVEAYFLTGGGKFLMETYAVQNPVTKENLMYNLDQIPLQTIQEWINNLMKPSFLESVPSKYLTIMNDARDPMFGDADNLDDYMRKIDTCLIANNGVVYLMNEVYTTAKYAAVSAPALVSDSLHIFNWAITADDKYISSPASAPLAAFMSYYLLSMGSNFVFFIPSDRALSLYYDPVSMTHNQPRCIEFKYDGRAGNPITAKARKYDPKTGQVDSTYMTTSITQAIINNRLKDMLDAHIVVLDPGDAIYNGNKYFITKGGAPVCVKDPLTIEEVNDPSVPTTRMKVYGGWQLDHDQEISVTKAYDKSAQTNGYGNGLTFIIDAPIQSTIKSVYTIMNDEENEDSPYKEFYNLCLVDGQVIEDAGFADAYKKRSEIDKCVAKYSIFTGNRPCLDQNVRFFNTYRYTVYVPDNESVKEAINNGLPTWESIANYIQERKDYIAAQDSAGALTPEEIDSLTTEYKTYAQAMSTCLLNFVKYHFQDNSIFVDNNPISPIEYETSCINNSTNRYITVEVSSEGHGNSLKVKDKAGNTRDVIIEEPQDRNYNMLARDMELNKTGNSASSIETSSYAVVHRINGVLNFKEYESGRYDDDWKDVVKAKSFTKKYRVRI